jgi:hypothetical protein
MPNSSERIVDRFLQRQAAMTEDKLREILLKIRKGATSSLNWKQLGDVLGSLDAGWKLEKIVGLVKLYGYQGHEESTENFWDDNQKVAEDRHKSLQPSAVSALPTAPKHGELYVMDLAPVTSREMFGKTVWEFSFKVWRGNEGWRVTTPDNKVRDEFPGRYDLGDFQHGYRSLSRSKIHVWDMTKWLNTEAGWLEQINKHLDMPAHEPAVPRTRDGTGSCPVCFQNIKAKPEMVLHGYLRPGTGTVHGKCVGKGYLPFEVSVQGTKDYLEQYLRPQHEVLEAYLRKLKAGKIDRLLIPHTKREVTPADADWEKILAARIITTEHEIKGSDQMLESFAKLVTKWKERPLPTEGGRHINWFYEGQQ